MTRLSRSQIKEAPYNPRKIDPYAKRKLKENIERVGLLQPLVWNRQTGNLVSGHQRLKILDQIEGASDYLLDVAVVDLDEKTEREQNVFMNNEAAMGTWDLSRLDQVVRDQSFDWAKSGFDEIDLSDLLNLDDGFFSVKTAPPEAQEHIEEASAFAEEVRAAQKETVSTTAPTGGYAPEDLANRRAEWKDQQNDKRAGDFYLVAVFRDGEQLRDFLAQLKLPESSKYVDGARLAEALGLKITLG